MSDRGRALAVFGLLLSPVPAAAFQLSEHSQFAFAQFAWMFGGGAVALLVCAAFLMRAVMRRPPGARFWEAFFLVVGLGIAVASWLVVCVVVWWNVLLPG